MTRQKYYVGCNVGARIVFRSPTVPTAETHGDIYNAVIGPFRTKYGASFMAKYGQGNPHCRTVGEAEKLAANEKRRILRYIGEPTMQA